MYQGEVKIRKEKSQKIWPRNALSVDPRSTAGRLGNELTVESRSTAGRPGKVRELQVGPVDCRSTGPQEIPKAVEWRSTAGRPPAQICVRCAHR